MRFSIIIPSFNQASFIERTLESVLGQGDVDLEVLVFDGGSTDGTVEILKRYDDRITWESGEDGGQADAINRGLYAATGDVLAYLNSDDIYYPNTLERVEEHFRGNPESLIVYGNADHIDEQDDVIETFPTESWSYERLGEICFISQPSVFWRREVIERFGFFDDTLTCALDYEYWLRIGRTVEFDYISGDPLAGSRFYPDTKTSTLRLTSHRECLQLALKYGGPVFYWLKALAHVSVEEERKSRCKPGTAWFAALQMERVLQFADEFAISLGQEELREIESYVKGATP